MSTKPATKPLILVDGSSYLFRAFHALPPLTNSRGEPTGAVYGVINMLRKLLKDYQPEYIAVVFDAKGKTFRDELFEKYKAHRPPMPDDLVVQIEPLHAIVRAMGLPCLIIDGVEADDVIGTLATQASQAGMDTLISTGDKDMAQLVDDHITLINTMTDTVMDTSGVSKKFGVAPHQIIDYLALIGDTSDNIPGIPGVGPKTATKWLAEYDSLDNIVAHAADIKGKIGEKLRDNLDQLPLSRELATIRCDVALDVSPRQLHQGVPDVDVLRKLYQQQEFKRWLAELTSPGSSNMIAARDKDAVIADDDVTRAIQDKKYQTIFTAKALQQWLKKLQRAELFAIDTETTSLDYMNAEIVGISFAVEAGEAAYIPLAHDYPDAPPQLSRDEVLESLRSLLEDPDKPKLGQNLKYDMSVFLNHGIHLQAIRFDTMLESYVLNSVATRHDMDSLALKYLGYRTIHYEDIAKKGSTWHTFNEITIEQAAPYAAEDADITLQLHQALWPRLLHASDGLKRLFEEIEMPLVPVLSRIERNGVLVDADQLNKQSRELAKSIGEIEEQVFAMAGESFNLGSPKQIQEILYDKLGLPVLRKTPKGQPSTAESTLQELALDYPLPKLILDHRALSKLKSTYTDKLPLQINTHSGRVHTSYHQAIASTGRLSSSDPNLQNIPVRSQEGRRIRQAFIASQGYKILAADYSQIELRILAHLSKDRGLLEAFNAGEDIHRATAAEIFATSTDSVTPNQRRNAKAINFGLIYGMSAFGLSRQLGIERNEAQAFMDLYFSRYPDVKRFMDQTRLQARDQGYVETLFGRRLYLPEINARNAQRRQYAERAAINAPMQGTAADIIKLAMINTDKWLMQSGVKTRIIMQVHDELVFEVPAGEVKETAEQISKCMTEVISLAVPLIIDTGIGDNWDEAH